MRCMRLIRVFYPSYKKCQRYSVCLFILMVFFSLTISIANAAIVAKTPHATHLIHDYLLAHPALIEAIEQTQDDTLVETPQLEHMSLNRMTAKVNALQPAHASPVSIYPVRSSALTPGKVRPREIQATLPAPIFIVGDDVQSQTWLNRYKNRLEKLHAKGFVVNVQNQKDMQALQQQFPTLSLFPIPGNAVATWLKIKHYPILISDKLIEQ
jgi:integrating conjugative element protein (TIGR03765 family)